MSGEAPQGLPRALDVQRFAGAREQEIRALVSALKDSRLGAKFGVAALPRHLRRRAGSHKPFHRHAFRPNTKLQGKRRKLDSAAEQGETAAEQADAAEAAAGEQQGAAAARPFTNRRMRRQPALLQQTHRESAAWTEDCLEAGSAACTAAAATEAIGGGGNSDGSLRRLETHVWHAKRLAMEERYGWLLPAGAAGQGRGSRSFVHVTKASALMHDASYLCPLLLSGSWHAVQSLLSTLLDPAEAEALAADWEASFGSSGAGGSGSAGDSSLRGDGGSRGSSSVGWEQEVMLHHPERHPLGAICPAQLLLCPAPGSGGGTSMQACLWVHPAAAAEAHAALKAALAQTGSLASLAVLNVRRLELRGGAADTALAVALAGATASGIAAPTSGTHARQRSSRHQQHRQQGAQQGAGQAAAQQAQQAQQQEALPPPPLPQPLLGLQDGEAVQLLLPDPRLCKPVALGSAAAGLLQPAAADEPQRLDMRGLLQAPLPLSEAELSRRRQQLRQRMLQLDQPSGGSRQAGQGAVEAQQAQQQRQREREQEELDRRGYCPAVLVRHDGPEAAALPGWSLIVPAGWVPPFWLAAAFAGCKPAGQREWRWLHTLQGRPCFPWDHPDTAGHAALMAQQRMQRQVALAKRPKAKQMLAAPSNPPDWHDVLQLSRGGDKAHLPAGQRQGAAAAVTEQGPAAHAVEEQGLGQPAAAMEVDGAAGAPSPASQQQLFVARSYAAMAVALQGSGSSTAAMQVAAPSGLPTGQSTIAAGVQQRLLQWRPRQQPAAAVATPAAASGGSPPAGAGQPCCLVEAGVVPIKTGVAAEGAAVCFIAGREGERRRTPVDVLTARQQRRRQREAAEQQAALEEAGGNPAEAGALAAAAGAAGSGRAEVEESEVRVIGYVSSEAPRGAPRRCGALAAVAAAPAWRLRALQHSSSRPDGEAIEAFVRNPGSSTLFPVRLSLLLEQRPLL